MNRWVRLGIAIIAVAILAKVGLHIFALGLRVAFMLYPLLILIGAGFVLYGLYRHWRRRIAQREKAYYDMLDD